MLMLETPGEGYTEALCYIFNLSANSKLFQNKKLFKKKKKERKLSLLIHSLGKE